MNSLRIEAFLLSLISLYMLSACSELVVLKDEGDLCFLSDKQDQPMDADSTLVVQVAVPDCLSDSCDVDREAECTVELADETITVKSELRYRDNGKGTCTMDCGRLYAECFIESVPAGTYSIVHGKSNYELQIPSSESRICYTESEEQHFR